MRVLLADNDSRICTALSLLLKSHSTLVVAGESPDVDALIHQAKALAPDLILLDWELPGTPDAALLERLRRTSPRPWIIALSGMPESERDALTAGADAFVSKADPPERLLAALDDLIGNQTHIAELCERMIK
jgi:DNA-binding NarL/FixJ family response regulator